MKIDLMYSRGFAFMIKMDRLIQFASKGVASLDNVAFQLLNRQRTEHVVQQKDWILAAAQYMNKDDVVRVLEEALDGELVVPSSIPEYRLELTFKEAIELGFAISSIGSRVISGLIPGSRAETAGLRNGDIILSKSPLRYIVQRFSALFKLRIKRGKLELQIEYWPRTLFTVTCWEFRPNKSL